MRGIDKANYPVGEEKSFGFDENISNVEVKNSDAGENNSGIEENIPNVGEKSSDVGENRFSVEAKSSDVGAICSKRGVKRHSPYTFLTVYEFVLPRG